MALEFNADKEIIKSDQLQINNETSVRFDVGGAANKKTAIFGTLSADIEKLVRVGINTQEPLYELDVNGQIRTTTSIISDTARINNLDIDTIVNPSLNLKAPVLNTFTDPDTGEVLFPRSASPAFDDDSNKIATTNFVYNIATNDLGGRIYVSKQIGNDSFDGRSATKPVSTIKRATQLAALTNDKETLIVAGGDYLEDNPISLPDQCSVVGDNIRLCIIRPQNPGKHMFKASNENYVTGITFRDNLNAEGNPAFTWGYAYVFDDKQRFYYPKTLGGQYGRTFELGHKIAAPEEWKLTFNANNGNLDLTVGLTVTNSDTLGTGVITEVNFDDNTDQSGYIIINEISGNINSVAAVYNYTVSNTVYNLNVTVGEQLTPDGQVVKHTTTHPTLGLKSVQYDPINYPQGLIFEIVDPFYHDYEVGQYVNISNMPTSGTYSDLNRFVGRQYISHRIETADGFSTKFVVFKDTPTDLITLGAVNGKFSLSAFGSTVTSDDHYVVFSLDNSPVKFDESNKSPNRYLDAVDLIGRNKTGIAAEALRRAKEEYPALVVPDESQCKTDIGHIVDAINYDLTWGGNAATKEAADYYYDAGALTHVQDQLKETSYAFAEARDLSIQAMRNQLTYVDTSSTGTFTRVNGYTGGLRSAIWDNKRFVAVGDTGAIHTSVDGSTWVAQTSGTTEDLKDVLFNKWAVGERGVPEYIAVGGNGKILTSNNPTGTWYSKTTPTTEDLFAVAYDGTTYVVVGDNGTVITSQNTNTWVSQTTGTTENLNDIIYNDDYDTFYAVGDAGLIVKSTDSGVTWTAQESGVTDMLLGISWTEGRMVITGANGSIITSDDGGLTWESNLVNNASPDNNQGDRYADAADLILANKEIIAEIAVNKMLANNTGFNIPTGNQACKDDVIDFLESMVINLEFGGNDEVYDAANRYVTGAHVAGEENESVEVFNYAEVLVIQAMRNEAFNTTDVQNYASGLVQYFDNTITTDPNPLGGNTPHTFVSAVTNAVRESETRYTPTTGTTYDPNTGLMVLEIGSHNLTAGQTVRLEPNSLTFSCGFGGATGAAAEKTYPRSNGNDPFYNASIAIQSATATTITLQVLATVPSTNTDPHTFVSATAGAVITDEYTFSNQVTDATYTPTSGEMVIEINGHGLTAPSQHTASTATYDPNTGLMVVTVANHGFANGDQVKFADNSITFSCGFGGATGAAAEKSYPRPGDYASGRWLAVSNVTQDTFTVQVLASAPSTNVDPHTFVSAVTNGIEKAESTIYIENNGLTFTCGMDNNATNHSYPRPTDPASQSTAEFNNGILAVSSVTTNTFTVNVGSAGTETFKCTNVKSAITIFFDILTNAIGSGGGDHTWAGGTVSDAVQSGGGYTHTFVSGTVTSNAGALPNSITDIVYTPNDGNMVITSSNHGLTTSNTISIADNALSFTCDMDGNTATKTYPRSTDPVSGQNIAITAADTNTFTINVGASPIVNHDVSDATYNPTTGLLELTIGSHSLSANTSVKIKNGSLIFTCDLDGNTSQKAYPRPSDPYYDTAINIDSVTATTITLDVGVAFAAGTLSGVTRTPAADEGFTGQANRYWDASDLILNNKKLIAAQAVYAYVDANSFTIPTGNQNCVDDVVDVLEAIAHDLRHGGNAKTYDAANYYVGTSHVDGEEAETIAIINNARDLAIEAMRGISITLGYLTDSAYLATLEDQFKLNIVQFTKPDITLDSSTETQRCTNVASAINTLTTIVTSAVANDNLNHATRSLSAGNIGNNGFTSIHHDGNRFWAKYNSGSNSYIYTSQNKGRTWNLDYTSNSGPTYGFAFNYDKGVVLGANNADILFDGVGNEFDSSINITAYQDETISNTYDANRQFACDNVSSSIFTLWDIVIDRINGRTVPATENATSAFTDSNNKFFNVGHSFDDLPIIEVSPYIFNSSVISFLGGSGCEIDGAKVATPNVKRPNLPPQGKSMVAAAFTIISFGGTGYRVFNDGYTQLVSVFCIFTQDGSLVESGGYASLTNSASNFGTFSLRASGVRDEAYSFHKGIVDNITFNDIGVPIYTVTGLGEAPLEHFIISPDGFELATSAGQNPRYFIEETESATPVAPITAEVRANKTMSVRGNYNRYTDASILLEKNARYIAEEAYFTTAATSSNTFDQNRDKCIRDVEEIVKAWAKDVKFDANDATWDAAKLYVNGSSIQHVAGYEAATKEVVDTATTLSKKAINNLLQIKGSTAQSGHYYVAQWTDEIPYVDTTVIHDISTAPNYVSGDCANVQSAIQTLSDLFDEIIDNPTVTTPLPSTATRNDGFFTINEFNKDKLQNHPIDFIRPSICNSSSHTWEYSGSGNDYNALPQNGGTRGSANTGDFEQVSQLNGRVYASGTDELGDFKIGYFANVENRTGNITFGGTVEISEVSFLKIAGSTTTIEGFGTEVNLNAIELGGVAPGPSHSILPTQLAVYQYINNQLGIYIGRTYSTTPTPNALVQLDNSGRINIDQLPALRPFNIFTVIDEAERLAFEGPLAGDIVIQTATQEFNFTSSDINASTDEFTITGHGLNTSDAVTYNEGSGVVTAPSPLVDGTKYYAIVVDVDTIKLANSITDASTNSPINITNAGSGNHIFETQGTPISFILNNDLESQILEFVPDASHVFSNGDITLATPGGGQGQVTNFLKGTVTQVIVNSGGSGYSSGDTVTFTSPTGGTAAVGTLTVNGGVITAVTLSSGGDNYFTAPSTAGGTISITSSGGSSAALTTVIRSRLSINILNNIKTTTSDTIDDTATPTANTITLSTVVNTSGFSADNWIQLTSSTIDASFITSGIINPTRLAAVTAQNPASSLTYLRGDSLFAPAVASLKIGDESPVVLGSNNSASTYIKSVEMNDGGTGYTVGTYTDTNLLGGNGQNLKGTIKVSNGTVRSLTITNNGTGYTEEPTVTFKDNWTDPQNPTIINGISARASVSGGQVVKINILDGGSGLGTNTPVVEITGGNGVDATATSTVGDGVIQYIQITDGGVNYTSTGGASFFTITPNPPIIGTSPTNAATLEALYATVSKLFNDITIDINRVNGNTPNSNNYSTIGVAKFRKSDTGSGVRTGQFIIGADGAVDIDQGQGSGFDADLLDNQDSNFYVECDNFVPGSSQTPGLPSNCLIGTYGIDIDGTSNFAEVTTAKDARTSTFQPSNYLAGGHLQWKDNDSNPGYANTWEFLEDGGIYHSLLTFRRGGTGSTFAEGATNQLSMTDNNNMYLRNSGANQVNSLSITTGGSGYVDGVYYDVPLGGGDGFGLKANLTVSNGTFTQVELTDKGWGYNLDGSAPTTFAVVLPFSYFGTQNTRQITTPAVITATLPVYQNNAGQNIWSSWRKIWHDGNMGKDSGLNADLMHGNDLRWMQKALNLSEDEQLMNSKMPRLMADHSFNEEIRITAPDPAYLINAGDVFDIYIEGYNLTQEQIESLDTQTIGALGVGTQLNLYTANDIAEGTATLINRKINLDPSNRETGLQYVEQNYEWTANTTFQKNDRVVYGHNVYVVNNISSGGYTSGTVAPVHGSGTSSAVNGTAQFQFERKINNPYTLLTVEITSGNLTSSIKKIGILDAPAELYPVTDFAQSSDETYTLAKARLGFDPSGNPFLELGNNTQTTSPVIDFKSSGNGVYDARISISGGSSTAGTGDIDFDVNTASVNGNVIWHAGNVAFNDGITTGPAYDTAANSKSVLRDSNGDFGSRFIYGFGTASDPIGFKGTASGNLALTGGTLSGNLNVKGHIGISETTGNGDRLNITSTSAGAVFNQQDNSRIFFQTDSGTTHLTINNNSNGGGVIIKTNQSTGAPLTVDRSYDGTRIQFNYSGNTSTYGEIGMTHYGNNGRIRLWMGSNMNSTSDSPNAGSGATHTGFIQHESTRASWAQSFNSESDRYDIFRGINNSFTSYLHINSSGQVGFNTTSNTTYQVRVNGSFAATSKSFVIDHPTKKDYQLVYGSLEGPEHGVYVRGKVTNGVIELPDYWAALVDEDTITVQLTAIGDSGNRWVIDVADNKVTTGGGAAFYFVQAERKDIDKLTVEVECEKNK